MEKHKEIATEKKWLICSQTPEIPRIGEGSSVVLQNGDIFFIYSRFHGGGLDHDKADLFGGILDLENGKVVNGKVFFPDLQALNQMSVSLERLQNKNIGIIFIRKTAEAADDVYFSRSSDEGKTWTNPTKINRRFNDKYIVVNSDRLRQFSSGRLAVPASIYPDGNFENGSDIAMYYSDDGGENWSLSERVRILDSNLTIPHDLKAENQLLWEEAIAHPGKQQEPGVEELPDGRILLYCRSTVGYMYQAFSSDEGQSWSELKAATDLVSPTSPQSIRRIPGTDRLLCVFNDRRSVSWGNEQQRWRWRTPLSIAISNDNATSWKVLGNIEDDSCNYCYTSILFVNHQILLTYYESENRHQDGIEIRRNLASLKGCLLDVKIGE